MGQSILLSSGFDAGSTSFTSGWDGGWATTLFASFAASSSASPTEAHVQMVCRTAGTYSNFYLHIPSNSTTVMATACVFRKNAANGNQQISIPIGTTGHFFDKVNTDSVVVGDTIAWSIHNTQTAPAFDARGVRFNSPIQRLGQGGPISLNQSQAIFESLGGVGSTNTLVPESAVQYPVPGSGGGFSNLQASINTNSLTSASTISFRKNTANGNQSISVASGATGILEDVAHSDSVVATDLVDYEVTTGSSALGGDTLIVQNMYVEYAPTNAKEGLFLRGWNDAIAPGDFYTLAGQGLLSTESTVQVSLNLNCVLSHLGVRVATAFTSGSIVLRLRLNGAIGNQAVSISTSTGYFEDASNKDSVAVTDYVDYTTDTVAGLAGAGQVSLINVLATFISTTVPVRFTGLMW